MSGYSKQIEQVVWQQPCNQLIVANELYQRQLSHIPELTYYKTLERLTKKGTIKHLTKGIYYRPETKESGEKSISDEQITAYYVEDGCGVVVGSQLYCRIGITEDKNDKTEILSTRLNEDKKNIGNIAVQKIDLDLNAETAQMIKMLDIMQNCSQVNHLNERALIRYLAYFCQLYSDDVANYVIRKIKYKKSTIAFLAEMLDKFGIQHSLKQYLSPLSSYKILALKKEGKDMPNRVVHIINDFSEKIKKLIGNKLSKIILYGSYARGDYRDNSDVDIMILVAASDEEIKEYEDKVYDLVFDIQKETGTDISPIIKNEEHFEYWADTLPFYRNVRDEGIVVSG